MKYSFHVNARESAMLEKRFKQPEKRQTAMSWHAGSFMSKKVSLAPLNRPMVNTAQRAAVRAFALNL